MVANRRCNYLLRSEIVEEMKSERIRWTVLTKEERFQLEKEGFQDLELLFFSMFYKVIPASSKW